MSPSMVRCISSAVLSIVAVFSAFSTTNAADNLTKVRVGIARTITDAPLLIGDKNGYFKAEGLDLEFIPFPSGNQMIAPLGTGQLEVGAAAPVAAFYNAVARGITVRVVADKTSVPPGYGFFPFIVRTELTTNGRFKTLKDLKGMTIAVGAKGSSSWGTLDALVKYAGLTLSDITPLPLSYPDSLIALKNGSADAALSTEPTATLAIKNGIAVRILGDDVYYPHQQLAVIMYGSAYLKDHRDIGLRFMRAYIRSIRFYHEALANGRLAGPNAEAVIKILTEKMNIPDPTVFREMTPSGLDPNGRVNAASMAKDLSFYRQQGWIDGPVTVAESIDDSFATQAAKELGLYKGS